MNYGGSTPSKVNTVDFITIATTGDATEVIIRKDYDASGIVMHMVVYNG